jgi:cell division protein FtsN
MTQDFAKIRPEPILERTTVEQPSAWLLMGTGVVVGLAVGVFACVLFYLSGNVPPLASSNFQQLSATPVQIPEPLEQENPKELQLEFYTALGEYEVEVDATPVEIISPEQLAATQQQILPQSYVLQTGAFEQQDRANSEMRRLQALSLKVVVKLLPLIGSTLYLVQSGPYDTTAQLQDAEQLLRRNNIASMRLRLQ